ncbi:hypothetical protein KP79_PYT07211 [Mizuhopecten yessoensis]|uniref:Uncharacterized protein n=1 Tax=Mizuhopecten yessoensis TaxID=6573 RepID=A0A210Q1Z3_MIZYE|nr:hypothetical protein KP79_PYT07211 [Mizuhopecten yessoensis]
MAVFVYQKDLELVGDRPELRRWSHFRINEQFQNEVEVRKKRLYPMKKHYKRGGHKVELARDRLFIDGELYVEPTGHNTEQQMTFSEVVENPSRHG